MTADSGLRRTLIHVVVPVVLLLLGVAAAVAKWEYGNAHGGNLARTGSLQAATETATAMLTYTPDTVDRDLRTVQGRLTAGFRESYLTLVNDVVIPGAKEKQVSATVQIPAAAVVAANQNSAVVLLFINQAVTVGSEPATGTASSVRVSLDNVDGQWLVAGFDPV